MFGETADAGRGRRANVQRSGLQKVNSHEQVAISKKMAQVDKSHPRRSKLLDRITRDTLVLSELTQLRTWTWEIAKERLVDSALGDRIVELAGLDLEAVLIAGELKSANTRGLDDQQREHICQIMEEGSCRVLCTHSHVDTILGPLNSLLLSDREFGGYLRSHILDETAPIPPEHADKIAIADHIIKTWLRVLHFSKAHGDPRIYKLMKSKGWNAKARFMPGIEREFTSNLKDGFGLAAQVAVAVGEAQKLTLVENFDRSLRFLGQNLFSLAVQIGPAAFMKVHRDHLTLLSEVFDHSTDKFKQDLSDLRVPLWCYVFLGKKLPKEMPGGGRPTLDRDAHKDPSAYMGTILKALISWDLPDDPIIGGEFDFDLTPHRRIVGLYRPDVRGTLDWDRRLDELEVKHQKLEESREQQRVSRQTELIREAEEATKIRNKYLKRVADAAEHAAKQRTYALWLKKHQAVPDDQDLADVAEADQLEICPPTDGGVPEKLQDLILKAAAAARTGAGFKEIIRLRVDSGIDLDEQWRLFRDLEFGQIFYSAALSFAHQLGEVWQREMLEFDAKYREALALVRDHNLDPFDALAEVGLRSEEARTRDQELMDKMVALGRKIEEKQVVMLMIQAAGNFKNAADHSVDRWLALPEEYREIVGDTRQSLVTFERDLLRALEISASYSQARKRFFVDCKISGSKKSNSGRQTSEELAATTLQLGDKLKTLRRFQLSEPLSDALARVNRLSILDRLRRASCEAPDANGWHHLAEESRQAFDSRRQQRKELFDLREGLFKRECCGSSVQKPVSGRASYRVSPVDDFEGAQDVAKSREAPAAIQMWFRSQ